jgi:hypothetical protein
MGSNPGGAQRAQTEPETSQRQQECTPHADEVQPQLTGDIPIEQSINPDDSGTAQAGHPPPK